MKGKLIVFSGPSGSGKTTIVKALLKEVDLNTEFSISAASREKRYNEIDGKDYYFLTPDEFKNKISKNAFVEWEEVYKNSFYGTLYSEIDRITSQGKNVLFDVDVKGGIHIKEKFEKNCLTIFVMPPSVEILEHRLRNRATESEESLIKRLSKAKYEMTFSEKFDHIIINDRLEQAIAQAYIIVKEFIEN
jgi:guanylate kinase